YVEDIPGTQTPDRKRVSFKVIRGVPKPTMTAPVGLPQGTVVDMDCSGIEQAGSPENFSTQGFSSAPNVTILFSPTGEVERIIGLNTNVLPNGVPSDTIYLMIGRWDRIPAMADPDNMTPWNESTLDSYSGADDGIWNYQDGANFWVTINPRTGMVSTTELNTDIDITQPRAVQIYQSREFARQSKRNLGGH
ncbi:MAG: hypothetical protein IKW74_04505, partial [Thermoguttaceae bacterium]|nr:hypothetical protein [Thermoguttaceae bacterium]